MGAWFCLVCTDTGQSERFDRDAEAHTKATGHGTASSHRDPVPLRECIDEVRRQLNERGPA